MGWIDLPATASTNGISWPFVRQFYYAIAERYKAAGRCFWPQPNHIWWSGTVPSGITATGFTDSSASGHWCTSGNVCPPWGCVPCPTMSTWLGSSFTWWLVIDGGVFEQQVKTQITGWTTSGGLTFNTIQDFVTAGVIPSIASLEGKYYAIIAQENNAAWTADRILEWPNDYEWARGIVQSLSSSTTRSGDTLPASPSATHLRDPTKYWKTNEHAGRDLLVYGTDGAIKRISIVSNDQTTLTFATQAILPEISSNYIIVTAGARGWPNRGPSYPYQWYRGYHGDSWYSHKPNDETSAVTWGSQFVGVPGQLEDDTCGLLNLLAWDNEQWTGDGAELLDSAGNPCGTPYDTFYGFDLYKTIRGLQLALIQISTSYCDASPSGGSTPTLAWNPAIMFQAAGINTYTGTTGSVVGAGPGAGNNQINVSLGTSPYIDPTMVWFSITRSDGSRNFGNGMLSGGVITAMDITNTGAIPHYFTQSDPSSPSTIYDNGMAIVVSPGFSAFCPREFKRFYQIAGLFVADEHFGEEGDSAIDPASPEEWDDTLKSCYGVGRYYKIAPSSGYIERRQATADFTQPQGYAVEDSTDTWNEFQNGDLARYSGDNWNDPSTQAGLNSFISASGGTNPIAPYWDHAFTGQLSAAHQMLRWAQLSGKVTAADTYFIQDSKKNWFDYQWFGGVMRTESGTATGGSTTSLSDSTKVDPSPPSVEAHCFWQSSRFNGFSGPYVGFTIEVLISGTSFDDPNAVIEKRLITSSTESTCTLNWSQPLSASASGKQYRIKEPYYLDRWIDRTLVLIDPQGNSHTTTILGNCDDTIFFMAIDGVTPAAGWKYFIQEPLPGTVWKRSSSGGGSWTVPSGSDSVRNGVTTAADFHSNQKENLPTYARRFGLATIGDFVGPHIWNELKAAIQALKRTYAFGGWTAMSSDGDTSPANNSTIGASGAAGAGTQHCSTFTDVWNCSGGDCTKTELGINPKSLMETAFADPANQSVYSGPPTGFTSFSGACCDSDDFCNYATGSSSAAYFKISTANCPVNPLSHTTKFFNFGAIDSMDSAPTVADCVMSFGDYTFGVPDGVPIAWHAWTQWGTGGGSGGDEFSPLLGTIDTPVNPVLSNCPSCLAEACPTCCPYSPNGTSGFYVLNAVAILTWDFEYA